MEVVIISDRRVKLAVREQLLKVSRGWRAQLVSQCRCGCRQYRVTVQKLVDVIVPVELLRVPLQKPSALSFQLSDGGAS